MENCDRIDSDIKNLRKEQSENLLKIRDFDEKLKILVKEQDIFLETVKKNKNCIREINDKVESKIKMVERTNEIKCKICEQVFDRISDLDEHVTTIHNKSKNSKCDFCGVEYALKWRLKEHMSSDHKQMQRTCHYYNNEKMCPNEPIGCKFAHLEAAFCIYGELCNRNKCPFRHRK